MISEAGTSLQVMVLSLLSLQMVLTHRESLGPGSPQPAVAHTRLWNPGVNLLLWGLVLSPLWSILPFNVTVTKHFTEIVRPCVPSPALQVKPNKPEHHLASIVCFSVHIICIYYRRLSGIPPHLVHKKFTTHSPFPISNFVSMRSYILFLYMF